MGLLSEAVLYKGISLIEAKLSHSTKMQCQAESQLYIQDEQNVVVVFEI